MPNILQTLPTVQIWDQLYDPTTGAPIVGATVTISWKTKQGSVTNPVVQAVPEQAPITTNANGYWTASVVPTDKLSPSNSVYTVSDGYNTYDINPITAGMPVGGWQTLAIKVSPIPATIPPSTTTIGALTVTGLLTAQAGLTVSAGLSTLSGGATIAGGLTVTSGGAAVTGNSTITGTLTVSGLITAQAGVTIAGGLTVTSGGAAITGNSTVTGTLTTSGALTVSAGGAAITGNSVITGTLTTSGALTVQAGGAAITGNSTITGTLTVSAAVTISAGGINVTGNVVSNTAIIARGTGVSNDGGTLTLAGDTVAHGVTVAGHLVFTGSTPTLGALQTGINTQSITGTDNAYRVTVQATGSPPGSGAVCAIITYATTFGVLPAILTTNQGGNVNYWTTGNDATTGHDIRPGLALVGSATYTIKCHAL